VACGLTDGERLARIYTDGQHKMDAFGGGKQPTDRPERKLRPGVRGGCLDSNSSMSPSTGRIQPERRGGGSLGGVHHYEEEAANLPCRCILVVMIHGRSSTGRSRFASRGRYCTRPPEANILVTLASHNLRGEPQSSPITKAMDDTLSAAWGSNEGEPASFCNKYFGTI
jgi:hypothetical protein